MTTDTRPWYENGRLYAAIYGVLSFLYFLPALLPGRHIYGTDYLAAGFFKHEFTSGLIADGTLPAWIPHVYGGVPLFANPAGTFFPTKLLADVFLPVTKLYPAMFVVHFALGGIGAYLLLRELGGRRWVAFVTGLAFQFTGLMMSFVYGGHDGRLIVATLAPLLFFFLHRGIRQGTLPHFVGAAATVGLGMLTFQIQSNYYLLLGGGVWALFCLWNLGYFKADGRLAKRLALGLGAVAFGFALAAVNFLPFLDYVDASPRGAEGGRGYEYSTSWSMPPSELTGLAVPEATGVSVFDPNTGDAAFPQYQGDNPFKLHTEYVGALVLFLVGLGFYYTRSRYWWFFVGLGLFGLSISLGGYTPLYRLYYEVLPGTDKFRAPSIAFFLVSFSLVMMAGLTLERIVGLHEEAGDEDAAAGGGSPAGVVGWAALAVAVAGVVLAGLVSSNADDPGRAAGVFRFAFFAAAIGGTLWALLRGRLARTPALVLLAVLTVADLWIIDTRFFHTVPPPSEMMARDQVAGYLLSQPERDRVWVLPFPAGQVYRNHGNYLMRFDIDQAGGEHGNQLQQYNEYVGAGQETYVDWHNFLQNSRFLNAANVRYIISRADLGDAVPFREVHRSRAIVYENPAALPRAYLVGDVRVADAPDGALAVFGEPTFNPATTAVLYEPLETPLGPAAAETGPDAGDDAGVPETAPAAPAPPGEATIVDYTANRVEIEVETDSRALLVLADNMYPGWTATVDGEPRPIHLTNHTFRGVVVEPEDRTVVFEFRNPQLIAGFWIYVVGLTLLIGYGAFLGLRAWQARTAARDGAGSDPMAAPAG